LGVSRPIDYVIQRPVGELPIERDCLPHLCDPSNRFASSFAMAMTLRGRMKAALMHGDNILPTSRRIIVGFDAAIDLT